MDAVGDFVVAWADYTYDNGYKILAQRYTSTGIAVSFNVAVNGFSTTIHADPSVAMDATGDFVVAWSSAGDGSSYGVFAQRFNAQGVAQPQFSVNTFTTGSQ